MSAVADIMARLIPEPENVQVPADVLDEAKAAGAQSAAKDIQAKLAQALAPLKCAQDQYGEFVIEAHVGQRLEVLNIDSGAGEDAIRQVLKSATSKMPPKTFLDNTKAQLRIDARNANRQITVFQRVARDGGAHIIDLGDPAGQIVRVENGSWQVTANTGIAFLRGRGYGALPVPIRPSCPSEALKLLCRWALRCGVPQHRALMMIVALVTWLRTGNAYPLLLFYGPPGSGKSVAARFCLLLIDPPISLALPNVGQDISDIAAAAQQRHVVSFDNASKLSGAFQDVLCTCATGGEIMNRRYYKQGESIVLPIHRPVLITAVQPVVSRPDLMSRTIPIEFAQLSARKAESALLEDFLNQRPMLLGALIELLAVDT